METRRQQPPTLPFKFAYANTLSLFAKKGLASTTAINLDGPEISYANILETATRDNRLVMA